MLLPASAETFVHSSCCAPLDASANNHTSSLLILLASTATFSLVVGTGTEKSASSKLPCLNIK